MSPKDTLGALAKSGKEFGGVDLAEQKSELVQKKARYALDSLRLLGVPDTVEDEPLSPVLRLVKHHKDASSGTDAESWADVLHTVGLVKYYVALANGEEPAIGPEDVLAVDMDEDTLRTIIAPRFGIEYLERTEEPPVWEDNKVSGILWGHQSRPFYALTVATKKGQFIAPFFSDSGSKCNYLNEGTFAALGFTENIPETATVRIQGYSTKVALAIGNIKGINTIGADYKHVVGGIESLDYTQDLVELRRTNPG